MCFFLTFFCVYSLSFLSDAVQSEPAVEYVQGVVTLNGTPLEGATVIFLTQMEWVQLTQPDGIHLEYRSKTRCRHRRLDYSVP